MDGTANNENTQGGGAMPVTPQHYPGHLNPGPFGMQAAYQQAAAAAFGLQGSFNGLMPSSDPRLSTFAQAQMSAVPPFSFSHGLLTPGETPGNQGKCPRVDHGDSTFDIDAVDGESDGGLLEQFQKLREDHDVLWQRVDSLEAALSAELEQLVHEYAFQLMGITKKRGPTSSTNSGGYLAGNPELKIPNWAVPSPNTNSNNVKFQQAILQLIKNNDKKAHLSFNR
ncbi:hypothetical protein EST38_g13386 [Candolleomyces aberdarensis]|uniref:Uncharacterized protein n=1 Tax=Candolleomyces aberdarensis TaxID=2316362 RepID=A0A4V1Q1R1_9AGAR|nr:hypothetical protein EST38_g13386 [Candolleomyces aberdarensis]